MKNVDLIINILNNYSIDSYYQPSTDEFFGEYTPDHLNRLKWLTAFTGSNGSVIISAKEKIFFTDGRYLEQARLQLPEDFTILDLKDHLPWNYAKEHKLNLGVNGYLIPYEHKFTKITSIPDLVDLFWQRERKINSEIFFYDSKFQGYGYEEKVRPLLQMMSENKLDYYIITNPDLICWLSSIRANDLSYTPLLLCYAIVSFNNISIYSNNSSLTKEPHITMKDISLFESDLRNLTKVGFDGKNCSYQIAKILEETSTVSEKKLSNPLFNSRGVKHPTEIKHAQETHIKDAIAMCNLLAWIDNNIKESIDFTEFDVAKKSEECRRLQEGFFSLSFPTIAGFAENSAIIHYKPELESCKKITSESILLIDSGGQYLGGTTDITRTVIFRDATKTEKTLYTLVLMGHIDIAIAEFPKGENGKNIDHLARSYLQAAGLNYPHSTGHGVGNFLGVHETPPSFSSMSKLPLEIGMIISNEPGYYLPGKFGIRIENLISVTTSKFSNDKLSFEDLTLVPHEEKLIEFSMLKKQHKQYLIQYYKKIETLVLPRLKDSQKNYSWLENKINSLNSLLLI
jgi:Xaa-Pro aminopeptidase